MKILTIQRPTAVEASFDDDMANTTPDPLHWWSPRKIVLQIVLLQLAYSVTATILMTFVVVIMGAPFRIDYIFLYNAYRMDIVFGWTLSFLSIITSILT